MNKPKLDGDLLLAAEPGLRLIYKTVVWDALEALLLKDKENAQALLLSGEEMATKYKVGFVAGYVSAIETVLNLPETVFEMVENIRQVREKQKVQVPEYPAESEVSGA